MHRLLLLLLVSVREQVNHDHDHGRVEQNQVPQEHERGATRSPELATLTCWEFHPWDDRPRRSSGEFGTARLSGVREGIEGYVGPDTSAVSVTAEESGSVAVVVRVAAEEIGEGIGELLVEKEGNGSVGRVEGKGGVEEGGAVRRAALDTAVVPREIGGTVDSRE